MRPYLSPSICTNEPGRGRLKIPVAYRSINLKSDHIQGTYSCKCAEGYKPTNHPSEKEAQGTEGCEDIDECQLYTSDCDKNAKCFNRLGTYECRCKTGSSSPKPGFAERRLPRNDQHLQAMLENY